MESITITISNDFHNSQARLQLPADGTGRILSRAAVLRIRRALCPGWGHCTCGGPLGERGPQSPRLIIEERADGRVGVRLTA